MFVFVFIYSSKQQCLVKTRCIERARHVDECVRHDWLFWTWRADLNGGHR